MKRSSFSLILFLGLILSFQTAHAQSSTRAPHHWHTAGAGLSTPLGFNVGASYSWTIHGPVFIQAAVTASKDMYVTQHTVLAAGPAVGVRTYTDVALLSLSAGPTYLRGMRGLDLRAPGTLYETASVNIIGQMLFRDVNMGFEVYTNLNPIRNVSGMRLIYRLGRFQ